MPKKHFGEEKAAVYKKVGFGMPYQGNHSAFPFKSPHKMTIVDVMAQKNASKWEKMQMPDEQTIREKIQKAEEN